MADHSRRPAARGTPPQTTTQQDLLRAYRPLQVLLIGLTFVTGVLDAATYLDLGHVFASNLTGNVVLLGIALARSGEMSAVQLSSVAVAANLVGVVVGARLALRLEPLGQRWIVTSLSVALGALILATLAAALRWTLGDYPAVVLLAFALGLNNTTANRLHISGETTTVVVTSTLTSLVAGLQFPHEDPGVRVRQVSAVIAILVGAMCGAVLLQFGTAVAVGTGVAIIPLAIIAYVITLPRSSRNRSRSGGR